jgi:hypothetical protein
MGPVPVGRHSIIADVALLEQLITDGDAIVEGVSRFVEGIRALRAPAPAPVVTEESETPASAPTFDTSVAAMENADAEQLVAIRKALAAGELGDVPAHVGAILRRRLGSDQPS